LILHQKIAPGQIMGWIGNNPGISEPKNVKQFFIFFYFFAFIVLQAFSILYIAMQTKWDEP